MGTLEDKLLTRINDRLFEYRTIPLVALLLVIIYVVKAQYVEAGTSAKDDVVCLRWIPWLTVLLLAILIVYVIGCITHNRLPQAKRNTVAALFVIDAESTKLYDDVRYKLVEAFSKIKCSTKITFSAVCIQAKRLRKYIDL